MFNQLRFQIAQIRENYYAMQHENETLRKEYQKIKEENDKLKKVIEKIENLPNCNICDANNRFSNRIFRLRSDALKHRLPFHPRTDRFRGQRPAVSGCLHVSVPPDCAV